MSRFAVAYAIAIAVAAPAYADGRALAPPGVLSDVLRAQRPTEGEYFGVYLQGKKVGYLFLKFTVDAKKQTFSVVNEVRFKARVGSATAERSMRVTKTYEAIQRGRLLSMEVVQAGDGGEQQLVGTAVRGGLEFQRTRPNGPKDTVFVPDVDERAEDADDSRVAKFRNAVYRGTVIDPNDLKPSRITATPSAVETRMLAGVPVKVSKVTSYSEKDKVTVENWFDNDGRQLEANFGPAMRAIREPKSVAMRIEEAEVFSLTRVTVPAPLSASAREVPGTLRLVIKGLPKDFWVPSQRQAYREMPNGEVELTITARPPMAREPFPVSKPPAGGLEKSMAVDYGDARIQARASELVRGATDSWDAVLRVSRWVSRTLAKSYGTSSDRASLVIQTLRGDCTEHSLLTVALLRAAGIPARRADGLVYLINEDKVPAFYWHEWVEAWVGEWVAVDPTFGQDVADATHFKLGEEASAQIVPLFGSLQIAQATP